MNQAKRQLSLDMSWRDDTKRLRSKLKIRFYN